MEIPNVAHPKLIKIGKFTFQVISRSSLTDVQALKVAHFFCRTHKLKKSYEKKVLQVVTSFEGDSAELQ